MDVEIAHYYRNNREGIVQGHFALIMHPSGQKILSCKHMKTDQDEWFAFPSLKITKFGKTEYMPIISYANKDYLEKLKRAVLDAIHDLRPDQIKTINSKNSSDDANQAYF